MSFRSAVVGPAATGDVKWSPDSARLASGSADGTVRIWNVADGSIENVLMGRDGEVKPVAWSPDGAQLAAGFKSGGAQMWETQTWTAVAAMRNAETIYSLAWAPDGSRLLLAMDNGVIEA
ncbi:MAG: hypothetical protein R2911_35995 [Caldilineaceae bacterium]